MYLPVLFYLVLLFSYIKPLYAGIEEEIGLSFVPPGGWEVKRVSKYTIEMEDPIGAINGLFRFIVHEDILNDFEDQRDWVITATLAHNIDMESNSCYGIVLESDTAQQDGLFSMYANGEYGDCEEDLIFLSHYRFVAYGNFGYELIVETDSLDMMNYYSLYTEFLDTVHILRDFSSIFYDPNSIIKNHVQSSLPFRLVNYQLVDCLDKAGSNCDLKGNMRLWQSNGRMLLSSFFFDGRVPLSLIMTIRDHSTPLVLEIIQNTNNLSSFYLFRANGRFVERLSTDSRK